jgi:hypothetical protein
VTFWLLSSSSSYYIFLACLMFDNWCSAFMHAWMEKHGVVQWFLTCLSTCPCLCKAQHDHGMKRMVAAQVDQLFSPTFCIKKKWTNCFTLSLHRASAFSSKFPPLCPEKKDPQSGVNIFENGSTASEACSGVLAAK